MLLQILIFWYKNVLYNVIVYVHKFDNEFENTGLS